MKSGRANVVLPGRRLLATVLGSGLLLLSGFMADATALEPASPVGAATVKVFLAGCRRDQGGCALAIGSVLLDRTNFTGPSAFCLRTTDYVGPLTRWLTDNPATAQMSPNEGIFLALKTVYPCT
ncbi:MAG: hypothetical protein JWP16_1093 [Alphaproteobacteria bacterium]|nr:hypothetical protein [Alphaproteobacteria bacterium]